MNMHIREFAELTGVSIRTLHYYHQQGLLLPAFVDKSTGYRFYDETSLHRMQEILFYRELDFSLKDIRQILSSPEYDAQEAFCRQKNLLILKKERLEKLITALEQAEKGEKIAMDIFSTKEYETARKQYEEETRQRWGSTEAYKESEETRQKQNPAQQAEALRGMDRLMDGFAQLAKDGTCPESPEAQALVQAWQEHISQYFYTCTKEILLALGEMYTADERFQKNIDSHGEGTAAFMQTAIRVYCKA